MTFTSIIHCASCLILIHVARQKVAARIYASFHLALRTIAVLVLTISSYYLTTRRALQTVQRDSSAVVVPMIAVFLSSGSAMVRRTAEMVLMKSDALHFHARRGNSNATTTQPACQGLRFVTATMTVGTEVMRNFVNFHVGNITSNAGTLGDVYLFHGNAMETTTVLTAQMKILPFATTKSAILIPNTSATMENAFQSCGTVTLMMTVGTIQMSLRTSAGTVIAPLAGRSAPP